MQVLITPLSREPLTEAEFYELGAEIPRLHIPRWLFRLLNFSDRESARARQSLADKNVIQIPAQSGS